MPLGTPELKLQGSRMNSGINADLLTDFRCMTANVRRLPNRALGNHDSLCPVLRTEECCPHLRDYVGSRAFAS